MTLTNFIPKSIDQERQLLVTLMTYYNESAARLSTLKAEHFSSPTNAKIYQIITDLAQTAKPVELMTVYTEAKIQGLKGSDIYDLEEREVPSPATIEHNEAAIMEAYKLRSTQISLYSILQRITEHATSNEVVDRMLIQLQSLNSTEKGGFKPISDYAKVFCDELLQRFNNPGQLVGYPTELTLIDQYTGGLQPGHLIIIGARPSHGKTALALTIARNIVLKGIPVGFVSLEMTGKELVERVVSQDTNIDGIQLRQKNIPNEAFHKAIESGSKLIEEPFPLFIDDHAQANALSIITRARLLIRTQGVKIIFVDYLQLTITGNREENRNQELSKITRALKQFAQSENIPVVVMSQLSRKGEGRTPVLGDLRDSGAIEQDANLVLFVYRPEQDGKEYMPNGSPSVNLAEISIAKQRSGPTGKLILWFQPETTAFRDYRSPSIPENLRGPAQPQLAPANLL